MVGAVVAGGRGTGVGDQIGGSWSVISGACSCGGSGCRSFGCSNRCSWYSDQCSCVCNSWCLIGCWDQCIWLVQFNRCVEDFLQATDISVEFLARFW